MQGTSPSEGKCWAVSPSLSGTLNLCLLHYICPVDMTFLFKHIFSAADKAAVVPCGANSEENLTGPIQLRTQKGTAV